MHLLGRVAPLFAPIHPAREPEHAEPKGPDRNRHQQHVNLEETHILRIHSRNLLSASLPNTCKKTPKANHQSHYELCLSNCFSRPAQLLQISISRTSAAVTLGLMVS